MGFTGNVQEESRMRLKGIRIEHKKNTAERKPVRMEIPETVIVPMQMHIGKAAEIIVKKGDTVKVGQLIGKAADGLSADIHSSVSGKVAKTDEITASDGTKVACVVITSDGKQETDETIAPPVVNNFESFIAAVKKSGAVGLGGAGFPSFVKLNVNDLTKIKYVIINAAECEPYITSDTRTMIDKAEFVFKGIAAIRKYMNVRRFIIGIENNKREAIEVMKKYAADDKDVKIKVLPSQYPQGSEKVLVLNTINKIIPRGGLPLDVGAVVINVTTLAFIAEYLETGMPLVEKCVTVDGTAVKEPKNIIAPIGTSIRELFEAAGGLKCEPSKVIYGGPMMGIAVPSLDEPVLKNTNAVIAMDEKEAALPKTTPCIGCGACTMNCPLRLDPRAIAKAYKLNDKESLKLLCVDICMECGCCSYVCPANQPLVQTNKLAKRKAASLNSKPSA